MTRRRWIADEVSGDQAFLTGQNADHLVRVLRARVGQQFEIATPDGVRLGEIIGIQPQRVAFSTTAISDQQDRQHSSKVHLYLAVFKFDRFEWAVEKCTELGVSSIVPMITTRTDAHLAAAAAKRVERWRRLAHGAAQQSRRSQVPEIGVPEKLEKSVLAAAGQRIVLAESEREQSLADLVESASEISIAVGPEGGWTESELALFGQARWAQASLEPMILRAETAAMAALAVVQAQNHLR
jgi:16S rRNA (uracil1498-N3)-methyltransferase